MNAPERRFPTPAGEALRVHCLGIGGMGVAPLAIYLSETGCAVSGEDDALPEEVAALLDRAGVTVGPLPERVDRVVYSSAIPASHPAFAAAAARGLPLVRRGEMLAGVLRGRKLVAVCGAHGKTTTTSMLVTALRRANFPAGYLIGGLPNDGLAPAAAGSNDWVVAEIDESDGTIDLFSPEITVATNLDWDHPDRYREPAEFEATFGALFSRTRREVLASDVCLRSRRIMAAMAGAGPSGPRTATFGRTGDFAAAALRDEAGAMTIRLGGLFPAVDCLVRASGEFNAANAAAALAAAQLMGVPPAVRALADFAGVRRRQGVLFSDGPLVVEDYAHHPAEIRALLTSLRRRVAAGGRLLAVFQPHRFSRTARFKGEFASALSLADRVILLDVYPAGEEPVAGGAAADLCAELERSPSHAPVGYFPGKEGRDLFRALSAEAGPADLVAFVGAGDIDRLARDWLRVRRPSAAQAGPWDEFARAVQAAAGRRPETQAGGAAGQERRRSASAAPPACMPNLATADDLRDPPHGRLEERISPSSSLGVGFNLLVPDGGVDGLVLVVRPRNLVALRGSPRRPRPCRGGAAAETPVRTRRRGGPFGVRVSRGNTRAASVGRCA